MKKRVLACLLVVCLVVAMLPATVFASQANPYTDVASGDWYYNDVMFVTDRKLMTHTGANEFEPMTYTNRAMLMTILARVAGVDTEGGATWYEKGLAWAVSTGVSDGTDPNRNISRQEIVTMLYRAAGSPYGFGSLISYVDEAEVADWSEKAMQWAVGAGILQGKDGNRLDPTGTATRCELAALLARYIRYTESLVLGGGGGGGGGAGHIYHDYSSGTKVSNGNGTHTAYCTCGNYIIETCSYDRHVHNADTETHESYCACGAHKTEACTIVVEEAGVHGEMGRRYCSVCLHDYTDAAMDQLTANDVIAQAIEDYENGKITEEELIEIIRGALAGDIAEENPGLTDEEIAEIVDEIIEEVIDDVIDVLPEHPDTNGDGLCDECVKFALIVESNVKVSMEVYKDYSVNIVVPHGSVNPNKVTLTATMGSVGSLGLKPGEVRSETFTLNTGLGTDGDASLDNWLGNAYKFNGATVNVNVDGKTAVYNVVGTDGNITATPNSEQAMREAWHALTAQISTESATDSSITIANGSWLLVEDKLLHFETENDLFLNNLNDMDALEDNIRANVKLSDVEAFNGIKAYVVAGTKLAVGNSCAVLDHNALVTITGTDAAGNPVIVDGTVLESLRNATSGTAMVTAVVEMVNELIGDINGATVNVTIAFEDAEAPHVHNIVTEETTCTTDGKEYCTECDYEKVTELAWGHDIVDGECVTCGKSVAALMKFELSVEAGNAVTMLVLDDYSLYVTIPTGEVTASSVTVTAKMQGVGSLGMAAGEIRSESFTLNTGLSNTPELSKWLDDCIGFQAGKATVVVDGCEFIYSFEGTASADKTVVSGKPVSANGEPAVQAARNAWAALTKNVTTTTQSASDSYVLIKAGSSVNIGGQKLCFEDGVAELKLDNFNDIDGIVKAGKKALKVVDSAVVVPQIVVAKGTQLAVGHSVASLTKDCTITVEGLDLTIGQGILGSIRNSIQGEDVQLVAVLSELVELVDAIVGDVDGTDDVKVVVEFN